MSTSAYLRLRLSEEGFVMSYLYIDRIYNVYSALIYPPAILASISEESLSLMSKEEIDLFILDLELKTTFES